MKLFEKIRCWFRKPKNTGKYKLGKLAAKHDPKNRTLKMAKYMADMPDPPEAFDNIDIILKKTGNKSVAELFPMDGNDRLGDCVVAGMAHYVTSANGRVGELVIPSEKNVINFYKKLSGCKDQGLVMFDTLKYWHTNGFYDQKILGFGRLELKNHKIVKQAIQLFGGVDLGFLVQNDAFKDFDNGTPWTPGPSDGGGHCVIAIKYTDKMVGILTWGGFIWATWEWWDAQVDEAFTILPEDAVKPGFAEGFDSNSLAKDFTSITS